jgi:hypothetical protein
MPAQGRHGGTALDLDSAAGFFTYAKLKLVGTVSQGDTWTIGTRYVNYSYTYTQADFTANAGFTNSQHLAFIADKLVDEIKKDTRYFKDADWVDVVNASGSTVAVNAEVTTNGSDVFLEITDARGFNLRGQPVTVNTETITPSVTQQALSAATFTSRYTPAYDYSSGTGTAINFETATVTVALVREGEIWRLRVNGAQVGTDYLATSTSTSDVAAHFGATVGSSSFTISSGTVMIEVVSPAGQPTPSSAPVRSTDAGAERDRRLGRRCLDPLGSVTVTLAGTADQVSRARPGR